MTLAKRLNPNVIVPQMKAVAKEPAVLELIAAVAKATTINSQIIAAAIMQREQLSTTGVGQGIGLPHGKIPTISKPILAAGKSAEGIDFHSLDRRPVYILFMLLFPINSNDSLTTLAQVATILRQPHFKKTLLMADTAEEIQAAFMRVSI